MDKRELHMINALEEINNEYIKLEQKDNRIRTKLIKLFSKKSLNKIRQMLRIKIIGFKCRLFNLKNVATSSNNMQYEPYEGNKKIVIYTCITGGYDNLLEPYYWDAKCDYIVFTDSKIKSNIYTVLDIPDKIKKLNNNTLINRYIKLNPHELFGEEYDYSIYIDGNIKQISNVSAFVNKIKNEVGVSMHKHSIRECLYDEAKILKIYKKGNWFSIKKQIEKYKKEGFPEKYGMVEAGVIVTDLKNNIAKKILTQWWDDFMENKSMRDQLSLPYILWKNNVKIENIATLGNNLFKNPKIKRVQHL